MLEPWAFQYKRGKKWLAWRSYQRRDLQSAAALHARTTQEAEHLRALGLSRPIAVVPNGMDLPELSSGCFTVRDRDREGRTALFVSRIHSKKGLLTLVEAWRATRPAGWRVIVAGPDERGHRHEVEQAVRRAGLEAVFRFVGEAYGEDKNVLFRKADLFILPSFSENFGVAIAEALAWGVPVITTKGTPWNALEKEGCGWWVDIGVEPLAEALSGAVALSDSERRTMGERGRALIEREFSSTRIAEQMLAVYRWVLGDGQQPECVV